MENECEVKPVPNVRQTVTQGLAQDGCCGSAPSLAERLCLSGTIHKRGGYASAFQRRSLKAKIMRAESHRLSARDAAEPQRVGGSQLLLQGRMGNGVVHNRVCVTGKRRATQIVRLQKRARLRRVVRLFQKEIGHTVVR